LPSWSPDDFETTGSDYFISARAASALAFAVAISPFAHAASASFTRLKALLPVVFEPASERGACTS
jgi:hypothetical protein